MAAGEPATALLSLTARAEPMAAAEPRLRPLVSLWPLLILTALVEGHRQGLSLKPR
jgi:hypothetical protein